MMWTALKELNVSTWENLLYQRLSEEATSWFICLKLWEVVLVDTFKWSRVQTCELQVGPEKPHAQMES